MTTINIYNQDCMEFMAGIKDKSIDLVIIDPPYNINKAKWDSFKKEDYIAFIGKVFLECQRVLKNNGSFYFFHNDFLQIVEMQNFLNNKTNFIFKQLIVWNKKFKGSKNEEFFQGFNEVEMLRNYQKMVEYCLYYTFQDSTGMSKIMGNCVYPIRDYIRKEILKAKGKIILKEINSVLGTATNGGGVASACLSLDKTVPAFITEEHYIKLQKWLNNNTRKDYKYLRKDYEDLRKDYEDLRYTFNNQKKYHSVWNFEIAKKLGHITPKPTELIQNIINHSSNKNDTVLDCFLGSGTTAEACIKTNRNFIGCELDKDYFKEAVERIQRHCDQLDMFIEKPVINIYKEEI